MDDTLLAGQERDKARIEELVSQLNAASEAYYGGRDEIMSNFEWDSKFDELSVLEAKTGYVLPESPTQNVSFSEEESSVDGQKEAHEFPALSLAKTKSVQELQKWADGRPIWISWKLDGLTLVLTYDNGSLTKILTRGNGTIGTNITYMKDALAGFPLHLSYKGHMVVRGEATISYTDFERINDSLDDDEEKYANPRNLASGTLALDAKHLDKVRSRSLTFNAFTLVYLEEQLSSWGDRMAFLEREGFTTVEHELTDAESLPDVIERWTQKVEHGEMDIPVDGLVITYDDTRYASSGSVTGHHATRAGLAFKWQDTSAISLLDHIEWSCAASVITPVAVFDPVQLEGTTVSRASLCNLSELERLGLGENRKTTLEVIKANKIIPKVIKVIQPVGTFDIPSHCPVCDYPTEIVVSENSGTRTLHCTNAACPAKQLKIFTRFVSKEGMNIDGISEQTLARFINLGWISEYGDIYLLKDHIQQIANLEGFGERSAANMMRSIEKSRTVEAQRLLYALTIPMCGIDVCKRLLSAYPLEELISIASETTDTSYFAHIPGIGPEKSASFIRWFNDRKNQETVARLLGQLTVTQTAVQPAGKKCEGLTFVITGDVHHYKNRNELKAYIESQGGRVAGSVSGSTSFLINNDITSNSGKNKKAKDLGIEIISEDTFIERYAQQDTTTAQAVPTEGSLF